MSANTCGTPEHKLVTRAIRRGGRLGTAWECECGNWHPKPAAQSPWGAGNAAPIDAVLAYIRQQHQEHAAHAATKQDKE